MDKVMVIGIAGGTGSGKTTITRKLMQRFGADVSVIYHDNYYKAHHNMPYEERTKLNYDHPNAFDTDQMIEDLRQLKQGYPMIVEGILIFENKELCSLMDIKVFVDADADVRILRRIVRDVRDRGRSLESVVNQYLSTVKPMHEKYVEPSKRNADIIVPEGGHNRVALELLMERVRAHLEGKTANG